jgi:hypothetical protein
MKGVLTAFNDQISVGTIGNDRVQTTNTQLCLSRKIYSPQVSAEHILV